MHIYIIYKTFIIQNRPKVTIFMAQSESEDNLHLNDIPFNPTDDIKVVCFIIVWINDLDQVQI